MGYIKDMAVDRGFYEVNARFGFSFGHELNAALLTNPNLTVLDIGCGMRATALWQLCQDFPSIKGIGIDMELSHHHPLQNLMLVKGDLFSLPVKEKANIAYCTHLFPDIPYLGLEEYDGLIARGIVEIAHSLKKGGIAFIDEQVFSMDEFYLDSLIEEVNFHCPEFNLYYSLTNDPDMGMSGNFLKVRRDR